MRKGLLTLLLSLAAAPAGAVVISDNFNRTNADLSVGSSITWTDVAGDIAAFANSTARYNNSSSGTGASRAESAMDSADHYAQCKVVILNANTTRQVEVAVRWNAASSERYHLRMSGPSGGNSALRIYRTGTAIGTGVSVAYAANSTIRLEVEGTAPNITLRSYYNGALQETITGEGGITNANLRTGIGLNGTNTGTTATLDDFEAGDLAGEAPEITYNAGSPATIDYDEGLVAATVATITATGNPLPSFSLSGDDAADFAINSSTGAITPVAALRLESPQDANADNVYQVTAVATNSEGSDSVDLTIELQDVGPILFASRITAPQSGSPVDVTASGAGIAEQQRGMLVWGNLASANATPVDSAEWGQGFAIGAGRSLASGRSDQAGTAGRYTDNETVNVDGHGETYAQCYSLMTRNPVEDSSSKYRALFDSRIAHGIRLAHDGGTHSGYVHALSFAGDVRVKIYHISSASATNDVTIDFEPNLCLIFGAGDSFPGSLTLHHDGFSQQAIGFAKNDRAGTVTHVGYSWSPRLQESQNGRAHAMISSDAYEPWDTNKQPGNDWRVQLSFPDPTTMRLHRLAQEEVNGEFVVVAIDTGDRDVAVGVMDFPTGTGAQTPTMTPAFAFTPQAMFFAVSRLTATDSEVTGASAGTGGYAVVTRPGLGGAGDGEYCSTQSVEDNTATSNSSCRSDDQLFYLPDFPGGTAVEADFTAFTYGGLTMNVTAAPASTLKIPFFAIAAEADESPPGEGGGLLKALLLYSSLDSRHKQQSHLDRFGVYGLSP